MKTNNAVIEFDVKLPKLSKNEKEVLKLLIEASKLVGPLYLEQENIKYPGANFYPHDATREEIEKAAKKDPQILSQYTVVERVDGKLVAVPYYKKYAKHLKLIADKLNQAAALTDNKEFGSFLKIRAKSLLDGSYDKAIISKLKLKHYILDISIGPAFHYNDHLFSRKASYHAWVGVLDKEGTDRFNNYKAITLSPERKGLDSKARVDNREKVKGTVLDVLSLSGLAERTRFAGIHFPVDPSFVEKYGSELILFNQPNDLRVKEQIMPAFEKFFPKEFREGYSDEDIRRGYLRGVALHELAHSYLYYKNAEENLRELFSVIEELAATVLGLKLAGVLLLKDRINNKQLESMIVTFIARGYFQQSKMGSIYSPMSGYAPGAEIFINYMKENGSLRILNGMAVPNFMKMFVSLHELSDKLEKLLAKGTYKEAQSFIKEYTK